MNSKLLGVALSIGMMIVGGHCIFGADAPAKPAAPARPARPTPAARDPHTAGYVEAKELEDGAVPPADADGNFIIGPTHKVARELATKDSYPQGQVVEVVMKAAESKIYPAGI